MGRMRMDTRLNNSVRHSCEGNHSIQNIHSTASAILVLLYILSMAGCANFYYSGNNICNKYVNCADAKCLNDGLIVHDPVDSSSVDEKISKFLSSVDTSSRPNAILNRVLDDLHRAIKNSLKEVNKNDSSKKVFNLIIHPDGSIEVKCLLKLSLVDSNMINQLNEKISLYESPFPVSEGLWVHRKITVGNEDIKFDTLSIYSNGVFGRSRKSIQETVIENVDNLRRAYNRRLCHKRNLSGRINIKFAIDHYGTVIHTSIHSSTINDSVLEEAVRAQVESWRFKPILLEGNVTEVFYPFVFSLD